MKKRTFGISIAILAIVLFVLCKSSLTACMSFSWGNESKISLDSTKDLSLPSCHQVSTTQANSEDKDNSSSQNEPKQCECALSYSDLLETKQSLKHSEVVVLEKVWYALHSNQSITKNYVIIDSAKFNYYQFNSSLKTIKLLI